MELRGAEPQSAAAVLRSYVKKQLEPFERCALKAETELEADDTGGEGLWLRAEEELKLDPDGRLNFELIQTWPVRDRGDKPKHPPVVLVHLWTGERLYIYNSSGRNPRIVTSDDRSVLKQVGEHAYRMAPLMGRFIGDQQPFAEILAKSPSLRIAGTDIDVGGARCIELTASTFSGDYRIFVDPEHDYVVRRAQVVRRAEDRDLLYGYPMSELKPGARSAGLPLSRPIEHTFTLDDAQVRKIEDRWIVASATYRTKTIYEKQRTIEEVHKTNLVSITFAPEFGPKSDAFRPEFPEGTEVYNFDLPRSPVKFQWKGGKPVAVDGI